VEGPDDCELHPKPGKCRDMPSAACTTTLLFSTAIPCTCPILTWYMPHCPTMQLAACHAPSKQRYNNATGQERYNMLSVG
jgi:hypothetical protein